MVPNFTDKKIKSRIYSGLGVKGLKPADTSANKKHINITVLEIRVARIKGSCQVKKFQKSKKNS